MNLPNASEEQKQIVRDIQDNNVIVDSVAGSGKTTCNLHIAKQYPNKNILLLTYNAKLKAETREKIRSLDLNNIEAHSYHSFCYRYYDDICYNDTVIKQIIIGNRKQTRTFNYDIIIIDETQDMSILYYELICKLYTDNNNKNAKVCILGDQYQSIFQFNGADSRYIKFAQHIFNLNDFPWKLTKLSQSFRITNNNSNFVNRCMLGFNRMISYKKPNESNVVYLQCDSYSDEVFILLKEYLAKGYSPEDIFILAPSLRSNKCPARQLENKIKTEIPSISVYVPVSDDDKLDSDILHNKLVFSTFHQVKGLERKIIIVYNFDNSYFKYFKKDNDPLVCPNELYVATTRALEHTVLVHNFTNDHLKFLDVGKLKWNCNYKITRRLRIKKDNPNFNPKISVTEVIRHLPSNIIDLCYNLLKITKIRSGDHISISSKTEQGDGYENVSEITGVAIPSYFEYLIKGNMSIFDRLKQIYQETEQIELPEIDTTDMDDLNGLFNDTSINSDEEEKEEKSFNINTIDMSKITPEELLFVANSWNTYKSGYLFKLMQIVNYDWLSYKHMKTFIQRLNKLKISKNSKFEEHVKISNRPELVRREFSGYIDCINGNDVYEFKCTSKLEKEHYIQLALYKYIYETGYVNKNKKYYMYNIINDSLYSLDCTDENLVSMVELIFRAKFITKDDISDADFIENATKICNKYSIKI